MLKNKAIVIPITSEIKCHISIFFEENRLSKRYQLTTLYFHSKMIASTWDKLVDFTSIFDAFNRNCLASGVDYYVGEVRFRLMATKDKPPRLNTFMYQAGREALSYDFSKYETLLIANKLAKIISKLDLENSSL
ncbi:MAG: hypothetical protein AB7S65_00315 [Sulfuricurvum sp.]